MLYDPDSPSTPHLRFLVPPTGPFRVFGSVSLKNDVFMFLGSQT